MPTTTTTTTTTKGVQQTARYSAVAARRTVVRVAVVGDKQVGKSSLVRRYVHDSFTPHYTYTQGGDIENMDLTINNNKVNVRLVDAAGHRYVRSLIKSLYRDVQGIMVVFDVTRANTFDAVQEWLKQIELVNTSSPVVFLVGNKTDLNDHRQVPCEQAEFEGHKLSLPYFETSAKTGDNVSETFATMLRHAWKHVTPFYTAIEEIKISADKDESEENESSCCSIS